MSNEEICFLRDIFTGTIKRMRLYICSTFDRCHDPGRTVSGETDIHSGSFNTGNAKKFYINDFFKTFYSNAKRR